MKEGERAEWRGDVFRSDLARVLAQLPDEAVIQRPFHDTITVFYAEDGTWVDDRQTLQIDGIAKTLRSAHSGCSSRTSCAASSASRASPPSRR